MKDEYTLDEVINMATNWANEQFIEVLNDHNMENDFFEKYEIHIKAVTNG